MCNYPTQLTQFAPKEENNFQQYNFEILNFTSLNFARSNTSTDSHTASMTAERRKLFDLLPRLNTGVAKKSSQSHHHGNTKVDVTQKVKFNINVVDHDNNDNNNNNDNNDDVNNIKKKKFRNAYRRASAPAKGLDYCYEEDRKNRLNIPSVHIETEAEYDDDNNNNSNNNSNNNDNDNDNDCKKEKKVVNNKINSYKVNKVNNNKDNNDYDNDNINSITTATTATVPITSPCDPPSLTPSSSISSLSSSVGMLSPGNNKPQEYDYHWQIKSVADRISSENLYKSESHSLPDVIGSPYDTPWSPAAMFLSNFASAKQSLPDDEGQQVGDYVIGKMIGHGGFSTVKLAHTINSSLNSMDTVAVKIVKNNLDSDDNDRVQALLEREVAIWRRLKHPNVVPMLSVVENDYATFIFSEYCPGGTLLEYVKKNGKREGEGLDEDEARNIFLEIAESIRYLHNDARLIHKDIKLENILLDNDDTWRICDFGLTEFQNSVNEYNTILHSDVGGSLAYCAPEQLRSPTPLKDPSVDIWSLGVVLFAMITGQLPFSDSFQPRLQFKIINGRYDESLLDNCRVSCELRDLLKGMFKTKSDQRLTISQVLEHRWCER